ncbi:phytanoyl-CoA dioxygenase family protein [Pendulispora albinea]|uniref:Phytanoyl-CoA dioxygenase family protein n=1 Tax=Pendulispora albinea TaxID=2741071 RepID=A0ABZ2M621_9BACT
MAKHNVFEDMAGYGRADLAGTYSSTARARAGMDPAQVDAPLAELLERGYVIVHDALDPETLRRVRDAVTARFAHAGGRNNFEGFRTRRLYGLLDKTDTCDPILIHPLALALLDRVLLPNYLVSQAQAIEILAGEDAQPLHYDDAFYPIPRPRAPLGAATIFAIDAFTEDNGSTVLLPESHRWGERAPAPEDPRVAAVMPPGSMLFMLGTLWHGGGANRTHASRLAVTVQYCQPYLRTQENYFLSMSRERVKRASPDMQRLLGYDIHGPFMGFVNGMHPLRVLE